MSSGIGGLGDSSTSVAPQRIKIKGSGPYAESLRQPLSIGGYGSNSAHVNYGHNLGTTLRDNPLLQKLVFLGGIVELGSEQRVCFQYMLPSASGEVSPRRHISFRALTEGEQPEEKAAEVRMRRCVSFRGVQPLAEEVLTQSRRRLYPLGMSSLTEALKHHSLKELHLVDASIDPEMMKSLTGALTGHSSLTVLNLNQNLLGLDGVSCLVEMVRKTPILERLYLRAVFMTLEAGTLVARSLIGNFSLTTLDLGDNLQITGNGISVSDGTFGLAWREALRSNSSLTQLHLDRCDIDPLDASLLVQGLGGNSTLKRLYLSDNHARVIFEHRRCLGVDADTNKVSFEAPITIDTFVQGLQGNSNLEVLDLGNNKITAKEMLPLGNALKGHPCLRELNLLDNNEIDGKGAGQLVEVLAANTSLTRLFLPVIEGLDHPICRRSLQQFCLIQLAKDGVPKALITLLLSQNRSGSHRK